MCIYSYLADNSLKRIGADCIVRVHFTIWATLQRIDIAKNTRRGKRGVVAVIWYDRRLEMMSADRICLVLKNKTRLTLQVYNKWLKISSEISPNLCRKENSRQAIHCKIGADELLLGQ